MKPSKHGDYQLSPRQRRILPLLLVDTQEHACQQTGVSRSTLFEWFKDENFTGALQAGRDELFKSAMAELKATLDKAVKKITALMNSAKKEDVQLRAAALIVEHALKIKQLEDIEDRVAIIERALSRG